MTTNKLDTDLYLLGGNVELIDETNIGGNYTARVFACLDKLPPMATICVEVYCVGKMIAYRQARTDRNLRNCLSLIESLINECKDAANDFFLEALADRVLVFDGETKSLTSACSLCCNNDMIQVNVNTTQKTFE